MKLDDFTQVNPVKNSQKALRSFFESKVNFESLNHSKAAQLLAKTEALIAEYVEQNGLYDSQNDSKYLQLLMMQEGLQARLSEADLKDIAMKDPKIKATMDKATRGQNLSPDEQKTLAALAMSEGVELVESEVDEAQTVLAAQDLVDRVAGMLEDAGEMQYKDLPAVIESIKNELGVDQASQFQQAVSTSLDGLIASLETAKTELDSAMSVVTGEGAMEMPADVDMDLPEPELGDEDGVDDVADAAEIDLGDEDDDQEDLGRERR